METINIAGVSCRLDKLSNLSYEGLFENAKNSLKWKGVKDADKLIKKELISHGFKPTVKKAGSDKQSQNRANDGGRASGKRRRNSRSSKK